MPELDDLDAIPGGNISDDDLLLIFDVGSGTAYKIAKSVFLDGVAFEDGDHDFGASTITDLTATNAEIANLTFSSGGAEITNVIRHSATVNFASIAANDVSSQTVTVTGAVAGDHVVLTVNQAYANPVAFRAYVSATNTVTIEAVNNSASEYTDQDISCLFLVIRTTT